MEYLGFYVRVTPKRVRRQNEENISVWCDGFLIEIFDKADLEAPVDLFEAAVDYELLENSLEEAEQLAEDYIGSEKKGLRKIVEEYRTDHPV